MSIKSGARLAELRKKNGYSQESLAEKLGLSRQAISKWERGESSPDTDTLIELARLYNVSLDELIGLNPDSRPKRNESTAQTDPRRKKERPAVRVKAKTKDQPPLYPGLAAKLAKFPFVILIAALYVFLGMTTHLWHPLWMMFLLIPAYYHFAAAAKATTRKGFLMGMPAIECGVLLFLILGFAAHAWKWAWIFIILSVFYYWYVGTYIQGNEENEHDQP